MNSESSGVGVKLKELRKFRKMTLIDLANRTGLSSAYLSNIERNQTSPTVDNLFKISRALGVEIIDIMTDISEQQENLVLKKEDRENLFGMTSGIVYETITAKNHGLSGVCITIDKECYDEVVSTGHAHYSELGIQVEGELLLKYNKSETVLREGDTIYIPKNTVHGYKKYGEGRCVTYWVHAKESE